MLASLCLGGFAGCLAAEEAPQEPEELAETELVPADPAPELPEAIKPLPVRPKLQPGVTEGEALPAKPAFNPNLPVTIYASWTTDITATSTLLWPNQYTTVTVTTNADVGPTPYYLRIWYYNGTQKVYLASCGSGTSCSGSVTRTDVGAFEFRGTVEDVNGVAQASDTQWVIWHGADTKLSVSPTTAAVNGSVTLTASMNQDIGTSPLYAKIFDKTTGAMLKSCGSGTSCSVSVSQVAATTHEYQAFLSQSGTTFPPPGVAESTFIHYATWATGGWSLGLTGPEESTMPAHIVATASKDVGPTPYYIHIFDLDGTRIGLCGTGSTCSVDYAASVFGSHIVAFVSPLSSTLPPANAQAVSNVITTFLVIH